MEFLTPSNPLLSQKIPPVLQQEFGSNELEQAIETMLHVAYGEQKDNNRPVLVGLAAPQIEIAKRIILVDTKANGKGGVGKLEIFINPEITWQSATTNEWYEGCYSTGNICGIVSRAIKIKLKAFNRTGKKLQRIYNGYIARIFQHEIDHLDGIRFPDRITDESNLHIVGKSEFPLYRDKEHWRNWKKKANLKEWLLLKVLV